MRTAAELRVTGEQSSVREVLSSVARPGRRSGAVLVVDGGGLLVGIFTDSDLARLLEQHQDQQLDRPIVEVMTEGPADEKSSKQRDRGHLGGELLQISPPKRFVGRSRSNHRVQFTKGGPPPRAGELVEVEILRSGIRSLGGFAIPGRAVLADSGALEERAP